MHDGISSRITKAEKARLHRQRVEAKARRQQQQQNRVAHQRRAMTEIELAQTELAKTGQTLRAVLSIAPLRQAYSQFQSEGGVTASDWRQWLDGECLGKTRHASKGHLRVVATCHKPVCRDDLIEAEPDDLTECDCDEA
jgi:hypothetical protein